MLRLLGPVLNGARPELGVIDVVPGLTIAFKVEPLGMLFALVASSLWIVNSIYSIGYMRANDEPRQTTFYVCFAVALGSTIGIAFAKNLFTLFLFYEALTLSTYPLVTHKRNEEAIRAGRIYLVLLLGTSLLLFLPAIIATWVLAGTLDFRPGGIFPADIGAPVIAALLFLYVFGIGKAAVMPLHFWLPAAMVAPTPVSALLHAVAVVKAGVFSILKVAVLVFGVDTLSSAGNPPGSRSLRARRSWWHPSSLSNRTISNAGSPIRPSRNSLMSCLASQSWRRSRWPAPRCIIAAHAFSKITLFFAAGSIYTAAHLTEVSQLDGIGRRMPWTMGAFAIGALGMIGVPPRPDFSANGSSSVGRCRPPTGWRWRLFSSAQYSMQPISCLSYTAPSSASPQAMGTDTSPARRRGRSWSRLLRRRPERC